MSCIKVCFISCCFFIAVFVIKYPFSEKAWNPWCKEEMDALDGAFCNFLRKVPCLSKGVAKVI